MIDTLCSTLIQSFLLLSEQIIDEKNDEAYRIIKNRQYRQAQLSLIDFQLREKLYVSSNIKLMKLSSQHVFLQKLMNAYEIYLDKHVLNLDRKLLK